MCCVAFSREVLCHFRLVVIQQLRVGDDDERHAEFPGV